MLEALQSKYIKNVLDRGTKDSKITIIEKFTYDYIPEYLDNIKGSFINLSTEIRNNIGTINSVKEEQDGE